MYRSGSFWEQFVTPAECLTNIRLMGLALWSQLPPLDVKSVIIIIERPELQPMACWATLAWFSIAHGALM